MIKASWLETSRETVVECVLSASDNYIETMNIKTIVAQPWLVDFVIQTQLLRAKNPEEKRVKSRACIDRTRLIELQKAIALFLDKSTSQTGEPLSGEIS